MAILSDVFSVCLLVLGFGFVIFWHELGHFLAAKWVGIRVKQFAVGMGHAMFSWRKGIGFKVGSTTKEYERRAKELLAKETKDAPDKEYTELELFHAGDRLGLGQTEYRLSWLPIGGYVMMLGQEDSNPEATSDDPQSYSKKSVGARMLVISAGVIMNIILAGVLFMFLFMYGFRAPAAVAGTVLPGSPAQIAGIRTGDLLLTFNGKPQHDFTKVQLNIALASPDEPLKIRVRHADGTEQDLEAQPIRRDGATSREFLALGVAPAHALEGARPFEFGKDPEHPDLTNENRQIRPGDVVTAINGQPVLEPGKSVDADVKNWVAFDNALQASHGKPIVLTVRRKDGKTDTVNVDSEFLPGFNSPRFAIAGFELRPTVACIIAKDAPAFDKLKPGDVIQAIAVHRIGDATTAPADVKSNIPRTEFTDQVNSAGQKGQTVDVTVLRADKVVVIPDLHPNYSLPEDRKGLGAALGYDDSHPVIAGVLDNTPAAGIKNRDDLKGGVIKAIDGKAIESWYDVRDALATKAGDHTLTLALPKSPKPVDRTISLRPQDVDDLKAIRVTSALVLGDLPIVRKTGNPLVGLSWGVGETRDLMLQFYVTIQRMIGGSVSSKNLMGPVGIFHAGSRFAFKGNDWLLWFLAMISANLAVVNFLPIPVVDGGHFVFLAIEKIRGKPVSPKIQEYALKFGLILILGLIIFVTSNDIGRFFGH